MRRTRDALDSGAGAIFEATFMHDGVVMMADVLGRAGDGMFDIIEMKQSTKLKAEHMPDMAIQRYVLEGAGIRVNGVFLMHLNPDCAHPDNGALFVLEDCTEESKLPALKATRQSLVLTLTKYG